MKKLTITITDPWEDKREAEYLKFKAEEYRRRQEELEKTAKWKSITAPERQT